VGLCPGHIVLDGDGPSSPPQKGAISIVAKRLDESFGHNTPTSQTGQTGQPTTHRVNRFTNSRSKSK